jgi:hypothetical protein
VNPEQTARAIARDEYGALVDSWESNHSCNGYIGCCGGGKEIDRAALERAILHAIREAFVAGWRHGYYDHGDHDCRMFAPTAERAYEDWAKLGA